MRSIERNTHLTIRRRTGGFSLMEVLVAMLVLAIGLLGLAALQAQSLRFNHDSYVRSQATILAYEMMDKLRVDPNNDYTDAALVPTVPDDCDLGATPTLINSATPLVIKCLWLRDIQNQLPSGFATITTNLADARLIDVNIFWNDREINNLADCDAASPGGDATQQGDILDSRFFDAGAGLCFVKQQWAVFP